MPIKSYDIEIFEPSNIQLNWNNGYHLYGALLERMSFECSDVIHESKSPSLNQYIYINNGVIKWHINALNQKVIDEVDKILLSKPYIELKKNSAECRFKRVEENVIYSAYELLEMDTGKECKENDYITLSFRTPCAFKSNGEYVIMPSLSLISKSLFTKWNSLFTEFQIDDYDGDGLSHIISNTKIYNYNLRTEGIIIKGVRMNGFVGSITVRNTLDGFQRQLLSALLHLSVYTGIGIKTSLGMGGVSVSK